MHSDGSTLAGQIRVKRANVSELHIIKDSIMTSPDKGPA